MNGLTLSQQTLYAANNTPVLALPELSFLPSQCWAILGPNGAGKSTLLRHISGLDNEQGAANVCAEWQGQPLPSWNSRRWAQQRSVLPQHHGLIAALTVAAIVQMAAYPWGGMHPRFSSCLDDIVQTWDIAQLMARRWPTLSGGEQQRVMLARSALQLALAEPSEPRLWLLDEPLAALDWPHQQTVFKACAHAAEAGATVLASVHDMNAPFAFASHALVMGQGHVLWAGEVAAEGYVAALEVAFALRLTRLSHPEHAHGWLVPLKP
ncbi:MAG: ATP-binding cassette domain-containing protein [Paraperlucidibaca sp.]